MDASWFSVLVLSFVGNLSGSIVRHHGVKFINVAHRSNTHDLSAVAKARYDPVCAVWGQGHYRTFDGKVYSVKSQCTYSLFGDCQTNSFYVHVKSTDCDATICNRDVLIYVGGHLELYLVRIDGDPRVYYKEAEVKPPTKRGSFVIEKTGSSLHVTSGLGFKINWDGRGYVNIESGENMKNKTCGLCGNNNGIAEDEFHGLDGQNLHTATKFATSWQMKRLGERCAETSTMTGCARSTEKNSPCDLLNSTLFSDCHWCVDPEPYMEICKNEGSCLANVTNSHCSSMEAYARACLKRGVVIEWRSDDLCPEKCSGGRVYMSCGPACEKTCTSTDFPCKHSQCSEGCHCPDGTVLHQGRCIPSHQCPCLYNGKEYESGEFIKSDCNICYCREGKWMCTNNDCGAVCHAIGDPHYQTFDGRQYQFNGDCSYYMMYDKNYEIIAENTACGTIEAPSTCTKTVTIITRGIKVELRGNGVVNIDNLQVLALPYARSALAIYQASSEFVRVKLHNGIIVLWDSKKRLYIYVPPHFRHKTRGLCGVYDHNQANDFTTLDGDIETNVNSFGNKWMARQCYQVAAMSSSNPNPCEINIERKSEASELCDILKGNTFKACHKIIDVEPYTKNCVHDLCDCKSEVSECMCPMLAAYADACSRKGVIINWRSEVPQCSIKCPAGQMYQTCGNGCKYSCKNIAMDRTCMDICVEGCGCPVGQALDSNNRCVPIAQCPCQDDGQEFVTGHIRKHGDEICECSYGTWNCTKFISKRELQCDTAANLEYSPCVSSCRKTCKNLHSQPQCNDGTCEAGCTCKDGFVWDEVDRKCVLPRHCTCSHGGTTYTEGQTIKSDCNVCTCKASQWDCTKKECRGVCRVWGDSHYTTFDGKDYEFQGECEHVLAKNSQSEEQHYVITAENVPCGSTGVTCAKTIRFDIGKRGSEDCKTITLDKEKDIIVDDESPFIVQEVGMFVSVWAPLGISLLWDRGTRVYISVEPSFKNKIHGLCGNFNGNQEDDFIGPNGGPALSKPTEFGDLWQADTCCPPSTDIEDTCAKNPDRKAWAEKSCGPLKSDTFSACHGIVPVDAYYERCVYDACGCDNGGECACVCTAMAVYAHECAQAGVPLKWRSQDLCPVQCEDCETYTSCIKPCSKPTCADLYQNATVPGHCDSDICAEGCDLKPCPEGEVYFNTTKPLRCVPENVCKPNCTLNGRVYEDGDRITDISVCDPCQLCFCDMGSVKITGSTCPPSTTTSTTTVSTTTESTTTESTTTESATSESTKTRSTVPITSETTEAATTRPMIPEQPTTYPVRTEPESETTILAESPSTKAEVPTTEEPETTKLLEITTNELTTPAMTTVTIFPETVTSNVPIETKTRPTESTTHRVTEITTQFTTSEQPEASTAINETTTIITTTMPPEEETTSQSTVRTPEVTTVVTTPHTTKPPKCTANGWTGWMNSYFPLPINAGDLEIYRNLRRVYQFCDINEIVAIQCRAVGDDVTAEYDGQNVTCNVRQGLVCYNIDQSNGEICYDYEVRFYCECPSVTEATTVAVNPTTTEPEYTTESPVQEVTTENVPITTQILPTIPPSCETTGWTKWMNSHNPANDELGDFEIYPNLRRRYAFCDLPHISAIDCQAKGEVEAAEYTGQNVTCNTKDGLLCYHADQSPAGTRCLDYRVRFYCQCGEETTLASTTQTVPQTTPTEENVYPTETTAIIEEETSAQTTEKPSPSTVKTTTRRTTSSAPPTTVPVELTSTPEETTSEAESTVAPTTTTRQTTTKTTKPTTSEEITSTQTTTTTQPTTTTTMVTTTTTTYPQKCHETGWTRWISVTDPRENEEGDMETYENIHRVYRHFCSATHVTYIQCRSIATKQGFQYGRDVHVTCDVEHGLKCYNKEQPFGECDDYEIRVFCQCDEDPCRHGLIDNVNDEQLSASSMYFMDPRNGPQRARLHTIRDAGGFGGWTAGDSGTDEWIQVDFLQMVNVSGLLTQGRHDYKAWVTDYRVLYSKQNCDVFHYIEEADRTPAIYGGNVDQNTEVINIFPAHIAARCIRINPVSHHLLNSLRLDVLGCLPGETTPAPTTTSTTKSTSKPTTTTTNPPITTPESTLPPTCVDGWTPWMNTDKPTEHHDFEIHGPGDYEVPHHLHHCHSFCSEDQVVDIECRVARDNITWYLSDDDKAMCDVKKGFICVNAEQHMETCEDYEVRFLCQCTESTTAEKTTMKITTANVTTKPTTTTTTEAVTSANIVEETTETTETTQPETTTTTTQSTTTTRLTTITTENVEEGTTQAITEAEITTQKPTTTTTSAPSTQSTTTPTKTTTEATEKVTTESVETTTSRKTTQPVTTTTTQVPVTSEIPVCVEGWTEWMNDDRPRVDHRYETRGPGDYELVVELRKGRNFCATPMAIECKESNSSKMWHMSEGDNLECDLKKGFVCLNADQYNEMCLDYEVRFWCDCKQGPMTSEEPVMTEGITMEATEPATTQPATVTSEQPVCEPGWTNWFNTDNPAIDQYFEYKGPGDYELVKILRRSGKICRKPEAIECREKNSSKPWHLTEDDDLECDVKNGFICVNDEQADLLCQDYEVRFWCECEGSTTTTLPSTTTARTVQPTTVPETTTVEVVPSTLPPACLRHGWTGWMNVDIPSQNHRYEYNGPGDYELLTVLRRYYVYCEEPAAIQCRITNTNVSWHQSDDDNLSCDLSNGFVCRNDDQHSQICRDYEVRVWCYCPGTTTTTSKITTSLPEITTEKEETTQPAAVTTKPSTLEPGCVDGWSEWYNMDRPNDYKTSPVSAPPGDYELVNNIRYYERICEDPDGIECRIAGTNDSWINSEDDNLKCALPRGFSCVNDEQASSMCNDYEIRIHCTCSVTSAAIKTTISPTTTTAAPPPETTPEEATLEPTTEQPMSTYPAECTYHGWTQWMNAYKADSLGDFETIPNLRAQYQFCENPSAISCRSIRSGLSYDLNGEYGVTCNRNKGLSCINALQEDNRCDDYEVRVYCVCATSSPPETEAPEFTTEQMTTQEITEKTTTSICPPGQEWHQCAFRCNETCDAFRHKYTELGICPDEGVDGTCIPGCRSVKCQPPHVYKDPHTCVKPSQCPCVDDHGIIRKPLERWEEGDCKTCICAENRQMCAVDGRCSATTNLPTQTMEATTQPQVVITTAEVELTEKPTTSTPPQTTTSTTHSSTTAPPTTTTTTAATSTVAETTRMETVEPPGEIKATTKKKKVPTATLR